MKLLFTLRRVSAGFEGITASFSTAPRIMPRRRKQAPYVKPQVYAEQFAATSVYRYIVPQAYRTPTTMVAPIVPIAPVTPLATHTMAHACPDKSPRSFKAPSVMHSRHHSRRKYGAPQVDANDPLALRNVVKKIEAFAPLHLAESWDNVGLLVEPPSSVPIKRVLLTNDLSEVVLKEAIEREAQLIISYHPLIFPHFKTLVADNWKERILGTLLEKRIALYSPHTAWDSVQGGVNDWLASAFGEEACVEPLNRHNDGAKYQVIQALFKSSEVADKAAKDIKDASPSFDKIHSVQLRDGRVSLSLQCCTHEKHIILHHLCSAENVTIGQCQAAPSTMDAGIGRRVILKESMSLQKAIARVKAYLCLRDVAVAVVPEEDPETSKVQTIAICAGSGGKVLQGVDADLYFTGEMSHHEVLDTVQKGIHVILTRHSNSERGFLEVAAKQHLKSRMPEIEFIVSSKDKEPLKTM